MPIATSKESLLTLEVARRLLRYEEETGKLYWCIDRKRRKAGDEAGSIAPSCGYRVITVNGRNYLQHRLAWLLHFGAWPNGFLDHKNGDRTDNKIENLRIADFSQNGANRKLGKRRGPGTKKGVYLSVRPGRNPRWRAAIRVKGKTKALGSFLTEEEAHKAYCIAASNAFGPFARTS